MKKTTLIGIVVILILVAAIFLLSPFSPLNKVNVGGEGIKLPDGYNVTNSSKTGATITNGSNTLSIYTINKTENLDKATQKYQEKYSEDFNVSIKKLNSKNSGDVYKTLAKPKGKRVVLYWFNHNDKTYQIRTEDADNTTDKIALQVIDSMN